LGEASISRGLAASLINLSNEIDGKKIQLTRGNGKAILAFGKQSK